MESIAHIFSPANAVWSSWTMLFLLLCAVVSEFMQPGVISQAGASLRVRTERVYKEAPTLFLSQLLITIFRIGTIAMALYLALYKGGAFSFGAFAAVCGITLAVALLKMAADKLLDYTFMLSKRFAPVYEHYSNIITIITCILYPCLLVLLRIGEASVAAWVLGIIALLFLILWIYRAGYNYIHSPAAILYFIIYIATLEVLPLALLFYLSSITLSAL
jgi:hypothetical protein